MSGFQTVALSALLMPRRCQVLPESTITLRPPTLHTRQEGKHKEMKERIENKDSLSTKKTLPIFAFLMASYMHEKYLSVNI